MTDKELLTTYRQEMHKIQIKKGFTDEQMSSYRQGFIDAIREYEQRIATDMHPVKHGRWIEITPKHSRCSCCYATCLIAMFPISADANFCPNCGARMDGDDK